MYVYIRNGDGGSSVMLPRVRSGCHLEPASSQKCSGQIRDDTELTPARSGPPCFGSGPVASCIAQPVQKNIIYIYEHMGFWASYAQHLLHGGPAHL